MDIKEISGVINTLSEQATTFFEAALLECGEDSVSYRNSMDMDRNSYWDRLGQDSHLLSQRAQETVLSVIALIIPMLKASPVLDGADEKDVRRCTKQMRAALKLRKFRSWDIEVLHDEGTVLGVSPPGQSEDEYSTPADARKIFFECVELLEGIIQLLKISPANLPDGLPV